ncbi:MAG TPA: protein kinase [Polyangia bacterium]|nr:protein kinase [Polyangia bacterium]
MATNEYGLPEGTLVDGRYEVRRLIGSGGMGAVYRATDMKTGHRVALKMLHAGSGRRSPRTEERQRRLLQEVVLSGRVDHKNVVRVQDFGFHKETPYIVMEFLDGKDLGQIVEAHSGPLAVEYVVDVMLAVCSALRACHGVNVVHRDLKPSNVMVIDSQSGLGWDIKVVDFSISKVLVEDDITEEGRVLGTVHYLAPEQFENRAAPASDQYAIGVLLYVLLTKRLPYGTFSGHALHQAIMKGEFTDPRELRSDLPVTLSEVIARAMKRRPEERFPSVFELGQALWEFGSSLGRENWKKYYFHQTPNIAAAKMSSAGVPLIKKILDGGADLGQRTALAHYESATAVLDATIEDAAVPRPRPDGRVESELARKNVQAPSVTAIDATLLAPARTERAPIPASREGSQRPPDPPRTATHGKSALASGVDIGPIPVPTSHSGALTPAKRRTTVVVGTIVGAALLGGAGAWFVERGASRLRASTQDLTSAPHVSASSPAPVLPSPALPSAAPSATPASHESSSTPVVGRTEEPSRDERRVPNTHHHHQQAVSESGVDDTHDDRTAAQLVADADAAFARGEYSVAAVLGRKAIKKDADEQAYLVTGDASFKLDDLATARTMYHGALKRNPSSGLARQRLEMVSAKQGQASTRQP